MVSLMFHRVRDFIIDAAWRRLSRLEDWKNRAWAPQHTPREEWSESHRFEGGGQESQDQTEGRQQLSALLRNLYFSPPGNPRVFFGKTRWHLQQQWAHWSSAQKKFQNQVKGLTKQLDQQRSNSFWKRCFRDIFSILSRLWFENSSVAAAQKPSPEAASPKADKKSQTAERSRGTKSSQTAAQGFVPL